MPNHSALTVRKRRAEKLIMVRVAERARDTWMKTDRGEGDDGGAVHSGLYGSNLRKF